MGELGSLIFYIMSFVASAALYWLYNKSNKKLFLGLAFLIPLLVGGLRYDVGTDYISYKNMYEANQVSNFGMSAIFSISSLLGGYTTVFFIYNLLTLVFLFLGIDNAKKEVRSLAYLCLLFLFYVSSFNIIKQALAISIIFFAYRYILKKNVIKWVIFVLLASAFHITAIICLPLYVIYNTKNNKTKIFALLMVVAISFSYAYIIELLSGIPLFSHYSLYVGENALNSTDSSNGMFFVDLMTLTYVLMQRKKLIKFDNKNNFYIYLFILGTILSFTGFFNPFVKRISSYFSIAKIPILGSLPYIFGNKYNATFNYAMVISYIIIVFVVTVYFLKQFNVIPYNFIWSQYV